MGGEMDGDDGEVRDANVGGTCQSRNLDYDTRLTMKEIAPEASEGAQYWLHPLVGGVDDVRNPSESYFASSVSALDLQ